MTPTAGRLTRHTTNTVCEGAFARGYVVDCFTERPRAHITIGRTVPARLPGAAAGRASGGIRSDMQITTVFDGRPYL